MREEFLHFIWLYQLFDHSRLTTEEGEELLILQPGMHNIHSGPDFSEARIRIGENVWIGQIEIHIKSSDWYAHNHHIDNAYKNVILHVVYEDEPSNGRKTKPNIPVFNLKGRVDLTKYLQWQKLVNRPNWIPCKSRFGEVPDIVKLQTIERNAVGRLERKTEDVKQILNQCQDHWEQTLLIMLCRSLGAKVNSAPFQVLSELLPLNNIKKLKNQRLKIEAILFGLAGFLKESSDDDYHNKLFEEYAFLKHKYSFKEMNPSQWKFMRMRPANFPVLRIAQLSVILNQWDQLTEQLFYRTSVNNFAAILQHPINPYWQTHYRFGKSSKQKSDRMGSIMVNNIIINTFVPFLYAYGKAHGNEELQESAIEILQQSQAEKNNIISGWKSMNLIPENAFESQGLIELKNEYCAFKKCLTCKIGVWILNQT